MKTRLNNIEETRAFAEKLAGALKPGDLLSLKGEMGAGKTTITQWIAGALGVKEPVTSPTFALVNVYQGEEMELNHLDLYRLERPEELETIDYESYFYPDGVTIVEWASKAEDYLPLNRIEVRIEVDGQAREIEIVEDHKRAEELVKDLK